MHQTSTAPTPTAGSRRAGQDDRPTRDLVAFVVLAFALTWVFTIPAGLAARGMFSLPVPGLVLLIIGGFGPLLAAVVMAARRRGGAGVRALFAQLDPRGVRRRWFVIPVFLVVLNVVPVGGYLAAGGALPDAGILLGILILFPIQVVFVATMGGGLDEEMGWRGYALPQWLQISGPLVANILLGVVWSLWHLPLWLNPTGTHAAFPFAVFLVTTVSRSILMGWLYCASGRSLFVAILAHAVSNAADGARYQLLGDSRGDLAFHLILMGTYVTAAVVATVLTRGRLGHPKSSSATRSITVS